jgi:hypothetical protein
MGVLCTRQRRKKKGSREDYLLKTEEKKEKSENPKMSQKIKVHFLWHAVFGKR